MTLLSIIAGTWGTLMALGNFIQAYKIFKLKESKEISIISWSIIFIGSITWLLYGVELNSYALIIANGIGIISSGLVVLGRIIYYKGKKTTKKNK